MIAVGLLASARLAGWRLTAWVTGFLPLVLGAASFIYYPHADSSLEPVWAAAAVLWGAVFIATAELRRRT